MILQKMRVDLNVISVYVFLSFFIYCFLNFFGLISKNIIFYVAILAIIIALHFLFNVFAYLGVLLKKVYLVNGKIYKSYNDYKYSIENSIVGAARREYKQKYISLISDKVKTRHISTEGEIRIKVKSLNEKYVSPWATITRRVFKNKDAYKFMIVSYKNTPVTVYYQKK